MGVSRKHLLKKDSDAMKVFIFLGFCLTIIGSLTAETWNQATSQEDRREKPDFDDESCDHWMTKLKVSKKDFQSNKNQAVFWQSEYGKKDGQDSKNMVAAQTYARALGKTTLEMTNGGRNMDKMKLFEKPDKNHAAYLWNCASLWFAQQVKGDVDVFGENASLESKYAKNNIPTFWNIELPALLEKNKNVKISYHKSTTKPKNPKDYKVVEVVEGLKVYKDYYKEDYPK